MSEFTVRKDVAATMRDGTDLRADVYVPRGGGPFPSLLLRTPYSKERDVHAESAREFAERGYLVALQDVRGRYASDGDFMSGWFSSDHRDDEDGYDTVEWLAALSESSGRVGTFGNSYAGWTQWELAHRRPPHLVCMLPQGVAANLLDREMSGVLRTGRVVTWCVNNLSVDARLRAGDDSGPRTVAEAEREWRDNDRSKWLWHLPLDEIPDEAMSGIGPHFRRWLKDHAADHFRFEAKHGDMEVPALITTGWYDQQIGSIKHLTGMRDHAATEHARAGTRLIVGPWTHTSATWGRKLGEVDFGPEAVRDFHQKADEWFRYWLKGEQSGVEEWPLVQLFVMGANRWRGEDEWPLAKTQYIDYYLHSGGSANTAHGDGVLSREPPTDEPPDEYVYDPRDPVMTRYSSQGQHEPWDQSPLDRRRDVLVYSTPPLEKEVEVTGPITVQLFAASTASDTDFVVKLVDRFPDGFAQEVCYGIVRARYRESFDSPSLIEPSEVYEYTIKVNPTSNLFKAGHRVQVHLSSSDFPNFDRNHNTGGDDYSESTLVTAKQTVFHDAERPSRVILPVIPD